MWKKRFSFSVHLRSGWVCFFIRFVEMCLCISVSAMDALQWMGAVRMRVQTADKNITIIHTTPVHQLTSGEDKSSNKSSIKTLLTSNHCLFRAVLSCKRCLIWCRFLSWFRPEHFFTGGSVIMDYGLSWFITNTQLLSSQDVNWWTGVVWIIVMFLSAVWTLILTAPIHCRASIAETLMQRHISTNLMKKQTHLHPGWPEGEDIFSTFSLLGELFLLLSICKCNV